MEYSRPNPYEELTSFENYKHYHKKYLILSIIFYALAAISMLSELIPAIYGIKSSWLFVPSFACLISLFLSIGFVSIATYIYDIHSKASKAYFNSWKHKQMKRQLKKTLQGGKK